MGPYRPLNIPTVETDRQVILDKASSTGPLLTTRNEITPCQANYLQPQSDFCFSISTPLPPTAHYTTWILSPHTPDTNDFTWTWVDLPLTSHLTPDLQRDDEIAAGLFWDDGNLGLLTSVAVSEPVSLSQSVHVLIPASSTGPGSQSLIQWILSLLHYFLLRHSSRKIYSSWGLNLLSGYIHYFKNKF